ncbi:predicted protein [Sclerotinia sclerotiorum 1980 UF-70]|uniref:Uncharacterized protein n=1 Tax=Sclerotinia sclerotiorum (strain ATCC 18683 / 1980 / Ss-1) TaxID=665079 RepID=A7F5J3_SCLS1|nr:predicted protein [Sclerotinia sclerotiorum 1980 UF-70]EDN98014.1 predicted protein [Sclerotinia sclerotiorum 1980 UF-70]
MKVQAAAYDMHFEKPGAALVRPWKLEEHNTIKSPSTATTKIPRYPSLGGAQDFKYRI